MATTHSLAAIENSSIGLPDAPAPQSGDTSASVAGTAPQNLSSITGTVQDLHGMPIQDVQVTLTGPNQAAGRMVTVDSNGAFSFAGLVAGNYRVTIMLPDRTPSDAVSLVLDAGEKRELPIVASRTPTTKATVHVTASILQVAEAQVKEAEKQRVLGVFPNFYTGYIWNSAPMTPKLKFKLALRSTLDPVSILVASSVAGAEQVHNTFPGYGRGWPGYGKRFGAAYADDFVGTMISRALLSTLFHQDPRYFYRGTGSVRSRASYAVESTFVTRGDNGRRQANYSHILGTFVTAGISNVYRDPSDRSASLTFRDGLIGIGSSAVGNLLREFLSRPLTTNVPSFANGKQ
jgi:hypothetical protein